MVVAIIFIRSSTGVAQAIVPEGETLDDVLRAIASEQAAYLSENGTYQQYEKAQLGNNEVEVHEYVTPDGSVGYQIITTETEDGRVVRITSQGVGPEASARSFDRTFQADVASSTPNTTASSTAISS